jgi:hypothetical protein
MKLMLKIKNGTPPMRKVSLRQITDNARSFGAGPLFNQILPLLMSPTLEDQERHLLVKVVDRVLCVAPLWNVIRFVVVFDDVNEGTSWTTSYVPTFTRFWSLSSRCSSTKTTTPASKAERSSPTCQKQLALQL